MSNTSDYLARAEQAHALAARLTDPASRKSVAHAAECWRLLAALEPPDPPIGFVASLSTKPSSQP